MHFMQTWRAMTLARLDETNTCEGIIAISADWTFSSPVHEIQLSVIFCEKKYGGSLEMPQMTPCILHQCQLALNLVNLLASCTT